MQCIISRRSAPEPIIRSPSTANPLLRYRLRWYAVSTARLLLRRWQALVLLVGVLASANASIFSNLDTFAHPVLLLVAPGHGPAWRCGYFICLMAAAALWAHMQRAQIGGGDFMAFAGSLPLDARLRRRVDLAVLLLADSPLLLMVAGALMSTAARGHLPVRLPQLLALAALVPLALMVQLAVLRPRRAAAMSLRLPAWPGRVVPALAGRHTPALRIAFAVLLRERRNETMAKAAGAAVLVAAAIALAAVFEHDGRAIAAAALAQGLVALHLSGMFRGLKMAHQAAAAYTGALPLAPRWWRRFDLAAVLMVGLPFLAALALLAWIEGASAARALASLVSYATLLCALRATQLFSERHAVVLSTVLAASWMALTIAYLY